MSLELRLKACHQERQKLEDYIEQEMEQLERELADAEQRNAALLNVIERNKEYILKLERTNWLLRQQLETTGVSTNKENAV